MIEIANFWENISTGGDRPFLIRRDGEVSYASLCRHVLQASRALEEKGLLPGARVGVLFDDEAKAAAAFAAAMLRGLVPVMLPHDIAVPRLEAICRTLEPVTLLRDESIFEDGGEASLEPASVSRSELAYLLFTSGTTAVPAGVEITRGNLCAHLDTLVRLFDFDNTSRVFNPTPIAHTDGLVFGLLLALATGGAVIRPGPFDLAHFTAWIDMLRQKRATHMVTNPTVLSLIDRAADRTDYFCFGGFTAILSSASQLRPELWEHFERRFQTEIFNLYGLTETVTSALYAGRRADMGPVGTLGKPIDCEARLDPRPDQKDIGELLLRGPHIFRGYWRNPERTAATFTPDGWMRTGDLARRNADGSYNFLGRAKAAINSGGTLILGEEVDECLLRHPAVAEAVTVGLPDDTFEEIAISAVVLKAVSDEAELTRHCRDGLEQLKVPKRIVVVPAIPRGDAGKPNLHAVRSLLEQQLRISPAATSPVADDLAAQVIELASLVFRTEPATLSAASTPQTVKGWDSFTHVNLMLQAEDEFAVRIPGAQIGKIGSLADLISLIRTLRATRRTGASQDN